MAKRKLGFAIAAILLFFILIDFTPLNEAIAQVTFRTYCIEMRWDHRSYKMVHDRFCYLGHYYDFRVDDPPDRRPGTMGFFRVWVTWIGLPTNVGAFKGLPH